eukprot:CAMPEP_0194401036 /NCGR_PEP_ID=MMETSP0174-20130528/127574_1 /TAXON_ID=216777 /ORGANISM="Proboscia alata, Strain PI-D3" /LENGTH=577 /DNA_ID=CAMNT_0039197677 /DNA_START=503 /DNA_END=2236 /DNA_ORIENTATION=-
MKVPNAVMLSPKLLKEFKKFKGSSPKEALLGVINFVKSEIQAKIIVTRLSGNSEETKNDTDDNPAEDVPVNETEEPLESEDADSEDIQKIKDEYKQLLSFLFFLAIDYKNLEEIYLDPVTDDSALEWVEKWNTKLDDKQLPNNVQPGPHSENHGMTNALTNFTTVLNNKFTADLNLASDIENGKHLKAWDNLPEVQRRTILNAGIYETRKSSDDGNESDPDSAYQVPTKPSESLMHILRCKTQARVQNYLHSHPKFVNNMFHADIGCCTALKNGMLQASSGIRDITNFSPFFCPPTSTDSIKANMLLLEEKAHHELITIEDLMKCTTQTIRHPKNYFELLQFVENFTTLVDIILDTNEDEEHKELIHATLCLNALQVDLKKNVRDWNDCFDDHEFFGVFFLDEVHVRFQRFLSSCASGDPSQIDLDILDFSKFTKKCRYKEINITVPRWLKLIQAEQVTKEGKRKIRDDVDRKEDKYVKRPKREERGDDENTVISKFPENFKVSGNYSDIFTKENRKGLDNPKFDDGCMMCHKIMGKGKCHKKCFLHNKAHERKTNDAEGKRWIDFRNKVEKAASGK